MGTSFAGTLFLQSGVPGPQSERFPVGTHVPRPERLERKVPGRNELVNLNLVKITASLDIQGPAAKLKGARRFLQGPEIFLLFPLPQENTLTLGYAAAGQALWYTLSEGPRFFCSSRYLKKTL